MMEATASIEEFSAVSDVCGTAGLSAVHSRSKNAKPGGALYVTSQTFVVAPKPADATTSPTRLACAAAPLGRP
jgi:hypothetical protein